MTSVVIYVAFPYLVERIWLQFCQSSFTNSLHACLELCLFVTGEHSLWKSGCESGESSSML